MTLRGAQQSLIASLSSIYEAREAAGIADWVLEHITGMRKIDRLLVLDQPLQPAWEQLLERYTAELLTHRPVQYILGEAWFAGRKYFVNEHVLIPRPETEELTDWISKHIAGNHSGLSLLDIGTGSGCIPITLAKALPQLTVSAIDISEDALAVGRQNAVSLDVKVNFLQLDILDESQWSQLPVYDIIVSNPPYIRETESSSMRRNVMDHEPHLALFVPDNDALLFYRKILSFAVTHLAEGGNIFFEINEALGKETLQLTEENGYRAVLRKDMQGKDRMLRAYR